MYHSYIYFSAKNIPTQTPSLFDSSAAFGHSLFRSVSLTERLEQAENEYPTSILI